MQIKKKNMTGKMKKEKEKCDNLLIFYWCCYKHF